MEFEAIINSIISVIKEEAVKVFTREDQDPRYMNQTVLGCRWRAFWGILVIFKNSLKRCVNILAYAIAKHRVEKHGEDKKVKTMITLQSQMSGEDLEKASSRGWNT